MTFSIKKKYDQEEILIISTWDLNNHIFIIDFSDIDHPKTLFKEKFN